jgi:hypothetical protein
VDTQGQRRIICLMSSTHSRFVDLQGFTHTRLHMAVLRGGGLPVLPSPRPPARPNVTCIFPHTLISKAYKLYKDTIVL